MEAKVQELWDRDQIHQCLLRYCRGADRDDAALLRSAFHDDCLIEHGKFVGGPEGFVAWARQLHATSLSHQHCILNHSCDLDGDTAHTETYFMFARMNPSGTPLTLNGGRYADRFEKRADQWRIAARVTLRDWAKLARIVDFSDLSALTSTAAQLTEAERRFMNEGRGPSRDRNDRSYERPLNVDPERAAAYRALARTKTS